MAKKQLKGIAPLFEETEVVTALFERIDAVQQHVAISNCVPNRFNPRRNYTKEALEELVQSMQEHGFIGALDGRQLPDGRVELAYGSRRLLAARTANVPSIPVFLHTDWDDNKMWFIALIENLVREDLTPNDEAETVGQMHVQLSMSVREIVRKIGKNKAWVEDRLALFNAPQDVKDMVAERPDSLRAASYLSRVSDPQQRHLLIDKVLFRDLTTRELQQVVQRIERGTPAAEALEVASKERELSARADSPAAPQAATPAGPAAQAPETAGQNREQPAPADSASPPPVVAAAPPASSPHATAPAVQSQQVSARADSPAAPRADVPAPASRSDAAQAQAGSEVAPPPTPPLPAQAPARTGSALGGAVVALQRFDPDTVAVEEVAEAIAQLDWIVARTGALRKKLQTRQ